MDAAQPRDLAPAICLRPRRADAGEACAWQPQPPALHDARGDCASRCCARWRRARSAAGCSAPRDRPAAGSRARAASLDPRRSERRRRALPRRRRPHRGGQASTCSRCATSISARRRAGIAIPRPGVEAPLSFGKLLDYRDPRLVGRHQVPLGAQSAPRISSRWRRPMRSARDAALLRRDPAAPRELVRRLPVPHGAQLVERARAGDPADQLVGRLATARRRRARRCSTTRTARGCGDAGCESVYQHAQFVRHHFSLHSSANNHLIGEAAGLFIAALTWPHWPRARAWLAGGEGDPRAGGAAAKRPRRRQPGAGRVVPAVRARPAAAHSRSPAGRTGSGSPRRTNRASKRCSSISPRSWTRAAMFRCSAIPMTAWSSSLLRAATSAAIDRCSRRGDSFRSRRLQAQGRRPRRQDALAPGRAGRCAV